MRRITGHPNARKYQTCPLLAAGLPLSDPIRAYNNFVAGMDTRLRNPKWVIEHLTRDKLKGEGVRWVVRRFI